VPIRSHSDGTLLRLNTDDRTMCNRQPLYSGCSEPVRCTATPATICHLCMLQDTRIADPMAIVYTIANICHTCKAASWPQQFPPLAGLDVLCQFWLQQLDMQELMFLSLTRSSINKSTEADFHLPPASQCALCAARTSKCTPRLRQCQPQQSHL